MNNGNNGYYVYIKTIIIVDLLTIKKHIHIHYFNIVVNSLTKSSISFENY